jgi:signal transduction histidine kinase
MAEAHALELASRRAALLSVIVREQYIHEAHTIILRDRSHVGHHDEWVQQLDRELARLRQDADGAGPTGALDAIRAASGELRRVFADEILTAVDRQDWPEVARAHEAANALVDEMTRHADALAKHFDEQAVAAERRAEDLIRIALAMAVVLGALAATVAIALGRRLWRSFAAPLATLESVARKVERGDRSARVPPLAAAELSMVGDAVNRMLDALRAAEVELVAAERLAAVGRVAAGVAHEINNPIAVIRGYVKTMQSEASDPALLDELAILDEEAFACQRIAQDLLVYSRSPSVDPTPTEASALLRDAASRSEAEASRSDGSAPVHVEAEPAVLSVDPVRLRQVVVNLIQNARDSGADAPVEVHGARDGDGYRIEVLDRGPGIAKDVRERLFEPFFTTRSNGTGLGLAVCFGLVTAHGGSISVEARAGGGSRFIVKLPGTIAGEASA